MVDQFIKLWRNNSHQPDRLDISHHPRVERLRLPVAGVIDGKDAVMDADYAKLVDPGSLLDGDWWWLTMVNRGSCCA